ncbi:MAG: GDSL-type esterase/lipase family protein, partial [Pseudomonadota bacterium]
MPPLAEQGVRARLLRLIAAVLMVLLPLAGNGCGSSAPGGDAGAEPPATGGVNGSGGGAGRAAGGSAPGTGGVAGGAGRGIGGSGLGSGGVAGGAGRGAGGGAGTGQAGATGGGGGPGGINGAAGNGGAAGQSGAGVVAAGVRWVGRVDLTDAQHPRFSWSGTGFVARFSGTGLSIQITSTGAASFLFKPVVDGMPGAVKSMATGLQTATIASGLSAGMHTVELYRQTEGSQGDSQLMAITIAGGGALVAPPPAPARLIEVVGDSITCGYGTLGKLSDNDCFPTESHWDTYAAVAARALGADISTIAMSGQGAYRNYGGDMNNTLPMVHTRALTNDASPLWDFRTQPQAVVVNLGTNDISNGKGDPGTPFETAYTGLLAS